MILSIDATNQLSRLIGGALLHVIFDSNAVICGSLFGVGIYISMLSRRPLFGMND